MIDWIDYVEEIIQLVRFPLSSMHEKVYFDYAQIFIR